MIKSVTAMGSTFSLGRCVPGSGNGPVIASIKQGAPGYFSCWDEDCHMIASIENCSVIVTYDIPKQKETLQPATL